MKAIIMAGGEGTRLRPLTCTAPKPMAKIMNKPVMEHIIELLKKHGIVDIGVTLRYMPDAIKNYFGDGSRFGVSLTYFIEDRPRGTAGSVADCRNYLDEDFLVISGDALCSIDIEAAVNWHKSKKAEATIILHTMDIPLEYGVVVCDKNGKILRFVEKPSWGQVFSDRVNTGIYILKPSVLDMVGQEMCDFSKDVFPALLAGNRELYGYTADGYWCDIGDVDVLRHCHFDIFNKKITVRIDGRETEENIFIGEGAIIENGAKLISPVYIGRGSRIRAGAVIDSYTVIGENSTINRGASVKRTVVGSGVVIGSNSEIRGAVICDRAVIRGGASVFEQSVIGEGSLVGEGAIVKPGVRVWPYKNVGAKETVSSNLVWGKNQGKNIFGEKGIYGEICIDMTAQLASSIGAATGSIAKGKIGVSSDGSPGGNMIKSAVISGVMSSEAQVFDLGEQPLSVTRAGVRYFGLDGGIHASVENTAGRIIILNEYGCEADNGAERKLQMLLDREDFMRAEADTIKDVIYEGEFVNKYQGDIVSIIKSKNMDYSILAHCESRWGEKLLCAVAGDLGLRLLFTSKNNIEDIAKETCENNFDLGVLIDADCGGLVLCDNNGRIADKDKYQILTSLIIMKQYENANIAVPVTAPSVIEELAEKYGANVTRTRDCISEQLKTYNDTKPEYREQLIYATDAIYSIVKILDYMTASSINLSDLLGEIPDYYIIRKEIDCAPQDKGRIIREMLDYNDCYADSDGVRVKKKDGYVLIIPSGDKNGCRVYAEAKKEEYAQELAIEYNKIIRNMLKKE